MVVSAALAHWNGYYVSEILTELRRQIFASHWVRPSLSGGTIGFVDWTHPLCQWDAKDRMLLSHQIEPSQVVVSATSVHRINPYASEMRAKEYWYLTKFNVHTWQCQRLPYIESILTPVRCEQGSFVSHWIEHSYAVVSAASVHRANPCARESERNNVGISLNLIFIRGSISDFRTSKRYLRQRDASKGIIVSHWIEHS
jgi:hypothetical protein